MVCQVFSSLPASGIWRFFSRAGGAARLASAQWRNLANFRGPKVFKGERREAGIQWIQPPKAVSDRSFRQTTSEAHGSAGRADCLPRGKPFDAPVGANSRPVGTPTSRRGAGGERKAPCWHDKRQLCRRNSPLAGPDAPTPARGQGLQPYGALTLFFRWRKKSVQKKASGTATPEAARPASRRGLRPAVALRAVLVLGSLRSPAGKKPFIAHF